MTSLLVLSNLRLHVPFIAAVLILIFSLLMCFASAYDISHWRESNPGLPLNRRSTLSIATGAFLTLSTPNCAIAASDPSDINNFTVGDFTISVPSNWKVTSKPTSDPSNRKSKQKSKIFSVIDLQSGSVITVVNERACSAQEYAQSMDTCNMVTPSGNAIFSDETILKDISKLLIRHDDRDNTALQGTTKLNSYDFAGNVLDLIATTTIPSGGTYRDTMGIDRPNTIDRRVKAKSLVNFTPGDSQDQESSINVLTLWLSAPSDEWQKPVMGTKLNQIWNSIQLQ